MSARTRRAATARPPATRGVAKFIADATAQAAAGTTTIAPAVPTGTANGDTLLIGVFVQSTTDTIATPAGWTLVSGPNTCSTGGALRAYLFRRIASSEPASYTLTKTGTNGNWRAYMVAVRGDFDVATAWVASDASTSVTIAQTTAARAGSIAVVLTGCRGASNTITSGTGYTQSSNTTSGTSVAAAWRRLPAAGKTPANAQTLGASATSISYHALVKPKGA